MEEKEEEKKVGGRKAGRKKGGRKDGQMVMAGVILELGEHNDMVSSTTDGSNLLLFLVLHHLLLPHYPEETKPTRNRLQIHEIK